MQKIIFPFIIFYIFSCNSTKEKSQETLEVSTQNNQIALSDAQLKNAGITTALIENKEIAETAHFNGIIEVPPQGLASVSAPSGGYVRKSNLMEGNYVTKGAVLAIIEDPNSIDLQQDYLLAKSNLILAQKELQRQKALSRNNATADKLLQKAKNEVDNLTIIQQTLSQKLQSLGIATSGISASNIQRTIAVRSPINGYISEVFIRLGQYVAPTEKLFSIVNTSDVHLVLKVFEKDIASLKIGQNVIAYTNQESNDRHSAEIILISKDIAQDRSLSVHCHFRKTETKWLPGTFINAEVEIQKQKQNTLPEDAIVSWENKTYLFIETTKNTFTMKEVHVGATENGYTEVRSLPHLSPNAKFVTKGAYPLLMALKNIEE